MNSKDSQYSLVFTIAFLFFCFVLVPVIFVYQGSELLERRKAEKQRQDAVIQISSAISSLPDNITPENYYLNLLNEKFGEAQTPNDFNKSVQSLFSEQKVAYDLLQWHNHRLVVTKFIDDQSAAQLQAWQGFSYNLYDFYADTELKAKESAYRKLLPVLGPHFFLQTYNMGELKIPFNMFRQFIRTANSPLVWFGEKDNNLCVVRLYPDSFSHETVVRNYFASNKELPQQYAFVEGQKVQFGVYSDLLVVQNSVHEFNRFVELDYVVDEGCMYYRAQLAVDSMIILIVPLESGGFGSAFIARLLFLVLTMFFAWFVRSELLVSGLRNMSIIRQTLVFTMISAGIPSLVLFFSGASYFAQRQELLVQQKYRQMADYLQNIDQQSATYLAFVSNIIEASVPLFTHELSESEKVSAKIRQHFIRALRSDFYDDVLYLLLDREKIISGYVYLDFSKSNKKPQGVANKQQRQEARMWWSLLKEYLFMLNGMAGRSGMPDDVALFVETSFQKTYQLLIGYFLDADGKFVHTGYGSTQAYLFIKTEDQADYEGFDTVVLGILSELSFARGYLRRVIDGLQRNPYGLRVYALSGSKVFPEASLEAGVQEKFAALSSATIHSRPQIVECNDEQWLFCGLTSKTMNYVDLVALFPLSNILSQVEEERRDLLIIGVIALALVLMLVLIFNFNLVFPIRQLNLAAEALESRDFNFRVATLPDDELGEMGRIFNRSIEDFEELHIASAVQARLFPQKALSFKNISLFARTVPMVELGGDYNDYFVVDADRVAVLLGDVAGHGVGASLIMAMAKAGIMCAKDVHDDPAKVLLLLHKLVVASKSRRQRKIMTFQYACFNHATGEGGYANAGGCHPLIVNPQSRAVRELASIGSPLGAFKKAKFSNLNFMLEPGEAIVFYTDGIVESRNAEGDEIGYDRFGQLLIDHFNSDAEQYYYGVYGAYSDWIHPLAPQDDVSLVILVRNS